MDQEIQEREQKIEEIVGTLKTKHGYQDSVLGKTKTIEEEIKNIEELIGCMKGGGEDTSDDEEKVNQLSQLLKLIKSRNEQKFRTPSTPIDLNQLNKEINELRKTVVVELELRKLNSKNAKRELSSQKEKHEKNKEMYVKNNKVSLVEKTEKDIQFISDLLSKIEELEWKEKMEKIELRKSYKNPEILKLLEEVDNALSNPLIAELNLNEEAELNTLLKETEEDLTRLKSKKNLTKRDLEDMEKSEDIVKFLNILMPKFSKIHDLIQEEEKIKKDTETLNIIASDENFMFISERFSKLLAELEQKSIRDINQLKKRKEIDKDNDFLSQCFENLRLLENKLKVIEKSYQMEIRSFENLLTVASKTKKEDLDQEKNKRSSFFLEYIIKFYKFIEIDETLKNLEDDMNIYPSNCIEKLTLQLIYNLKFSLINGHPEIEKCLLAIKSQLLLEKLDNYEIKEVIRELGEALYASKLEEFTNLCEILMKKLCPINVFELGRLFTKTEQKSKEIKGKCVILPIGNTGAGKSTTICYLSFCKMKKDESRGHIDIDPEFKTNIHCKISYKTKSETRYINPIPITFHSKISNSKETFILCDTPGFLDTAGPEVDMANGLGIITSIKQCKGVKPVLVFGKMNMGNRFQFVELTLQILVGIINNLGFKLNCIDYLYTNFLKKEEAFLRDRFTQLRDDKLKEKNPLNQLLAKILDDMLEKLSPDKILDPLDGHPEVLLEKWLKSDYIENCNEVFKFDVTQDSETMVEQFCNATKRSVKIHIEKLKNFDIADFKLSQLKTLYEIVKLPKVKKMYDETIDDTSNYLNNLYTTFCESFNKGAAYGNNFSQEDKVDYRKMIASAESTREIRKNHLNEKVLFSDYFENNLLKIIDQLIFSIKSSKSEEMQILNSIAKIYSLSSEFKEYKSLEQKTQCIRNEIEEKMNDSFVKFEENLKKIQQIDSESPNSKILNCLQICLDNLVYIRNLSDNLEQHLPGISEKSDRFREELVNFFQELVKTPMEVEDATELINSRYKNINILEIAKSLPFDKFIKATEIKQFQDNILSQIEEHCKQIFQEIEEETGFDNSQNNIQFVEHKYNMLSLYHDKFKDPKFKPFIEPTFKEASEFLKTTLTAIVDEINKIIDNLQNDNLKMDSLLMMKLGKGLNLIQQQEWVKKFIKGFVRGANNKLTNNVLYYLIKQRDSFIQFDLRLSNYGKLPEVFTFLEDISRTKGFESLGKDLKDIFVDIEGHFKASVDKVLKSPDFEIQIAEELETTNEILNYLYPFKEVYKIRTTLKNLKLDQDYVSEAVKRIEFIEKSLKTSFDLIDSELESTFKKLKNNDFGEEDAWKYCSKIIEDMKKLKKISKLDRLSKIPQKRPFREWVKEYDSFYLDFSNLFTITENPQKLYLLLNVCKQLSKLDSELGQEYVFSKLYDEKFLNFKTQRKDVLELALKTYIPYHEFSSLKEVYDSLDRQGLQDPSMTTFLKDQENQITSALNKELNSVREQITKSKEEYQRNFLRDVSQIKEINESIKILDIAQKEVGHKIKFKSEKEKHENIKKEICSDFTGILKRLLNHIRLGFENRDYDKMEDLIQNIVSNLNFDSEYHPEQQISDVILEFGKYRKSSLDKILIDVGNLTFQVWDYNNVIDYYIVLEKLSKREDAEINQIYRDYKEKFYNSLRDKIESKVSELFNNEFRSPLDEQAMEKMKTKFPEPLQAFFKARVYVAENQKKREQYIQNTKEEITKKIADKSFNEVVDLQNKINEREFPDLKKEIQEKLIQANLGVITNLSTSLGSRDILGLTLAANNVSNVLQSIQKLQQNIFKDTINEQAKKEINKLYKEKIQNNIEVIPEILNPTVGSRNPVDLNSVINDVKFMNELFKERNNLVIFKTFPGDYEDCLLKVKNIIVAEQEQFDEYCQTLKPTQTKKIKEVLINRQPNEKLIAEILNKVSLNNMKECPKLADFVEYSPKIKINTEDLVNEILLQANQTKQLFVKLDFNAKEKIQKASRIKEYEDLQTKLLCLDELKTFKEFNPKLENIYPETVVVFKERIDEHIHQINITYFNENPLKKFYELKETDCVDINNKIENFSLMTQFFPDVKQRCKENSENIKVTVRKKLDQVKESATLSQEPTEIATIISKLQAFQTYVTEVPQSDSVSEVLLNYKKTAETKGENGMASLNNLGLLLLADPMGKVVISENKLFKGMNISLFNQKMQKFGIEVVLNGTKKPDGSVELRGLEGSEGKDLDKNLLQKKFDEFDGEYKHLIEQYLKPKKEGGINLKALKNELDLIIETLKSKLVKIKETLMSWFRDAKKDEIPKILAHLFAIWTLMNAEDFYELSEGKGDATNKGKYLLQPHPSQVISIFRMLSCGDTDDKIKNNLVQIGTGEGKSITLAMTATVLILLGYSVDCACYSTYLSERDYKDFENYFSLVGVKDYVEYGSFSFLCEKCINSDINIREATLEFFGVNANVTAKIKNDEKRKKVLLIDEVDVFFSKEFFGASYNPSAVVKNPLITKLFGFCWSNKSKITKKLVMESMEYKECVKAFPKMEKLLKEAVLDLLCVVKMDLPQNYEVKNDRIGYKEQDSISFDVSYGYLTTFTYFLEKDKGNITQNSLQQNTGLIIKMGSFSYAEIPKIAYDFIMGVTGTLETLGQHQMENLRKNYKIAKHTIMPSVYGKNNRDFNPNEHVFIENFVENNLAYHLKIIAEIEKNLKIEKNQQGALVGRRSVLVFFTDEKAVNEFYTSQSFQGLLDKARILTEKADNSEKKAFVSTATLQNLISLMPRCFGRGTDFKCRDDTVLKAGGVHVIQTFLSEDKSEEIQIQGRCARQGDSGSYSMALLKSDLEKFQITDSNLPKNSSGYYEFLDTTRNKYFEDESIKNEHHINDCLQLHNEAMEFKDKLLKFNQNQKFLEDYFLRLNKGVETEVKVVSRTLCVMDATGSMGNLLDCGKKTIKMVFERAKVIAEESNYHPDCFEVAIGFYRNYSSGPIDIFQSSSWIKKSDDMQLFLNNHEISGGQGNEAIEIALWNANRIYDKDQSVPLQIMIIGDAAANTPQEVNSKRAGYKPGWFTGPKGEDFWNTTIYNSPTYYEKELDELKQKNIKVYTFYVANYAKNCFEKLTTEQNGCKYLDINNAAKGSQELLDTLAKVILKGIGGKQLEEKYDQKYAAMKLQGGG